ncbi:hypothetical protein ABI59_16510 [Acidobacteria bacterium Mor1]|nr:hypothetical protein ABI59_16510 [Acidobacteria bacterium Mor1]
MSRPVRLTCLSILLLALVVGALPSRTDASSLLPEAEALYLTEGAYPIRVSYRFSSALFHWLDSMAGLVGVGMSGGKTVEAHRREHDRRFERSDADNAMLRMWGEVRQEIAREAIDKRPPGLRGNPNAVLEVFLAAADVEDGLKRCAEWLPADRLTRLRAPLEHFAPRYRQLWQQGSRAQTFLEKARTDQRLPELEALLSRMTRFYDVDLAEAPTPELVLAPVIAGYGTHAQAIGPYLLVELRPYDRLEDVASVIVHENAHFLDNRQPRPRVRELLAQTVKNDTDGAAYRTLREALPTALGQGVADRLFRPKRWRRNQPWYHREDIDRYAKKIYRDVNRAMRDPSTRLDRKFLRRLFDRYDP